MATFRIRFKLNPGRTGIVLSKLSKQTENIEHFLRSLAADLGESSAPNMWLAKDFKEGSFIGTDEYQAVVTAAQAEDFNKTVKGLIEFKSTILRNSAPNMASAATLERFASLRESLDADEQIGIALFDPDSGKPKRWSYVDRLQLEQISASIETEVRYIGSVMGRSYDWNMGAKEPYLIVRELNTGELIRCNYDDGDYHKVARVASPDKKSAVLIVNGLTRYNRITGKTEVIKAQSFEFAPEFDEGDLDAFIGCAPDLTGDMSTLDFINKGRDDE